MTRLISKIQYAHFEIGEFTAEKERVLEDVLELIELFPWEAQRMGIVIGLTNPSITIQGKNEDYLKLALYYNGKFVLHYFDGQQRLYTKSFSEIAHSYKFIRNYFTSSSFDTKDFKIENTIFQRNLKHFLSKDFRYEITGKSASRYLFATSGINLAFTVIVGFLVLAKQNVPINGLTIAIAVYLFFLLGGGLNLIMFFNYYRYAKSKILIMSKGCETFYFGNRENPIKYNKADITQFTISKVRNGKHPLSSFALVSIEFKDGSLIKIPNIIVDHLALEHKLSGIPKIERFRIPKCSD